MYDLNLDKMLDLNSQDLYETYQEELDSLKTNRIAKQIIEEMKGESINRILEAILKEEAIKHAI